MGTHEFSKPREIVEKIQQGKQWQIAIPKLVAVGDTVEFVSAQPLLLPHEALDFPDENSIIAVVQVSKVEPGPGHGFPWLIHWDAPASAGTSCEITTKADRHHVGGCMEMDEGRPGPPLLRFSAEESELDCEHEGDSHSAYGETAGLGNADCGLAVSASGASGAGWAGCLSGAFLGGFEQRE